MDAINEQLNVKTRSTSVVENAINNDPSLVKTKKAILRLEYWPCSCIPAKLTDGLVKNNSV